jgi:hypothetical protein
VGFLDDLVFIVESERTHRTGGHTGRFLIIKQGSVIAKMAFAGDALVKVELGHLPGAGLKAVATADALFFIDDHRAMGQLGYGGHRTDADTGGLDAMLAGPLHIVPLGTIFSIDTQIDYLPVISVKMGFPVRDQFIPLHSQIVPALAGRHATFATDAPDRISKHSVSRRLGSGDTGRAQDGRNRSTGH